MMCKRCNGRKTVTVFDPRYAIAQIGPCPKCNQHNTRVAAARDKEILRKLSEV